MFFISAYVHKTLYSFYLSVFKASSWFHSWFFFDFISSFLLIYAHLLRGRHWKREAQRLSFSKCWFFIIIFFLWMCTSLLNLVSRIYSYSIIKFSSFFITRSYIEDGVMAQVIIYFISSLKWLSFIVN